MYNKVFLIGNLTRDPEMRYTGEGLAIARFGIAINRTFSKDKENADNNESVDFINIVAWRKLAEICGEYLKKGRPVAIEGRLQIRTYKNKEGENVTASEVVAENMQMLGRKPAEFGSPAEAAAEVPAAEFAENTVEEEIPF